MCLCYCDQERKLVSSVNMIGTSTFEELRRVFTYNKINNGPSTKSCDTPPLISFYNVNVSADSVIFLILFPII